MIEPEMDFSALLEADFGTIANPAPKPDGLLPISPPSLSPLLISFAIRDWFCSPCFETQCKAKEDLSS
jgi:hypothetical protein